MAVRRGQSGLGHFLGATLTSLKFALASVVTHSGRAALPAPIHIWPASSTGIPGVPGPGGVPFPFVRNSCIDEIRSDVFCAIPLGENGS